MIVERTPPATLPVTVEAVRRHLRLDGDYADELLLDLIAAATADLEGRAALALRPQTIRVTLDGWPQGTDTLRLPVGPVTAPLAAPATVTLDGEPFADFVVIFGPRPRLRLTVNPPEIHRAAVVIDYVGGWAPPHDLPADLAFAVMDQAAVLFDAAGAAAGKALDGNAAMSPAFQRAVGRWRGVIL